MAGMQLFDEIMKFNPYHRADGRFASADGATSFTYKPGQGSMYDRAIRRERERSAGTQDDDTPRIQTVHQVEDRIRGQFYETAAVVDKDGNIVLYKDGAERMVGFTAEECQAMKGKTLTHNHPGSSMFSTEDTVCFMQNDLQEMRATTREGVTYSMRQGKGYTPDRGQKFSIDYDGELKAARRVAQRELDERGFMRKIMEGEITQEEANREFGKVIAREMSGYCKKYAERYGIEFTMERRDAEPGARVETYAKKSAGGDDMILDQETERLNEEAFRTWLEGGTGIGKSDRNNQYTILKTDEDKRLVFGWASVSLTVDGEQLLDRQYDMIDPEDLEEAAYNYVLHFRDTGEEHIPSMRKKGKLVESCVLTAEKQRAMGIPEGVVPVGWWIGFHIDDDDAWERVKNGTYKMFSIEGRAEREPVEKAAKNYDDFPSYDMWLEENLDATREEQKAAKEHYRMQPRKNPFEKAGPTGCGVIVLRDGKVLTGTRMERASRGQIGGPGGHIEPGETPEHAARREAMEEFNISCEEMIPLGTTKDGRSAVFVCSEFDGEPECDEEEMSEARWMDPGEIREEDAFPPFYESLKMSNQTKHRLAKTFDDMMKGEMPMGRFDWIIEKSDDLDHIVEIEKFNPYHGKNGRFASADGATSFTYAPGKSDAHDLAIARASAKDRVAKAKAAEPKLTGMMQECAKAAGGKMVGLEYAVKSESSLTRKIKTEMKLNGSDVKAAVDGMRDVNRYTMQLKEDNFVSGFNSTMETLQKQGYEVVRVKNSLGDVTAPYRGVNTNIKSPDGSIWELQFHTSTSLEIKEVNHKLYETQRMDKTPQEKRAQLGEQMAQNAASIPTPVGIDQIVPFNKI